jgi:Zn-dependent peptidase ImmA (M78 family)
LLQGIELEDAPGIPQLDPEECGGAERAALSIRSYWRLPRGPIKNLVDVVETAGGIVVFYNFGTGDIDGVGVRDSRIPPLFFINTQAPVDRQRFTLAHELGHVVMHAMPSETMEAEANLFAAEFLMPASDIGDQLGRISLERLANLKPVWRTSMSALLGRARSLKTISESTYKYWQIELSRAGYRTREPAELDLTPEFASTVADLFRVYSEDLQYSAVDIGRAVHDSVDRLRRIFPMNEGLRLVG